MFGSDSPNLDCLRALAVAFVVFDHLVLTLHPRIYGLNPAGRALGNYGVLIFFVHTSLVLMLSMQRSSARENRLFLPFYVRRFFRIYPVADACVFVIAVSAFSPDWWGTPAGPTGLTRMEIWSNLLLAMNVNGSRSALSPFWSLPFEVDMYLLLPLLYLFATRFRRPSLTFALYVPFGLLAVAQKAIFPQSDIAQYTGCFLPGILAYQLSFRPRFQWPAWAWPLTVTACGLAFVPPSALHFWPGFLYQWLISLAIGLTVPQFRQLDRGIVRVVAHTVAKYSYGIYITHVFALYLGFVKLAHYPLVFRWAAFLAALAVLPYLAYEMIERPGIILGKKIAAKVSLPKA